MEYTEVEMKQFYRKLFDTKLGKIVLEDILNDLHFFDNYVSEDVLPLVNYSKVLMWKIGVLDNSADNILAKLLELEPNLQEAKDE